MKNRGYSDYETQPAGIPMHGQRHVYKNRSEQWFGCVYDSYSGTWGFRPLSDATNRREAFKALDTALFTQLEVLMDSGANVMAGEQLKAFTDHHRLQHRLQLRRTQLEAACC